MRRILFAIAFVVFGGAFAAVSPSAMAMQVGTVGEISKAAPESNVTPAGCCYRRYYVRRSCCGCYRPGCYQRRYYRRYYRRYRYHRHYIRCWRHYGHYHCYWR